QEYYNKVHWSEAGRIRRDLEFIAAHTGAPDLIIVDSNFGMFKQDLDTCHVLAELQQSRGWPSHIHVSAGKNRKERVIEAASIVNGAINLSATIQSMDLQVLENVKRRNISLDDIVMVGKEAEKLGANSYSEIILCLPGDTREAHFNSVATMVDVGINVLRMYQLMMLPGSEMSSVEVRRQHEMQTRYRVLPRCFGNYAMWDRQVPVYEIEEICVANSTMSYHDYLDCRELNLSSELFYNSGVFREVISLLTHYGIAPSRFLLAAHEAASATRGGVAEVYDGFRRETHESLWTERAELEAFLAQPGVVDQYLDGTLGSNELFKYRAAGFFHHQDDLHDLAFEVAARLLEEAGLMDEAVADYLAELKRYSCYRKTKLLDTARAFEAPFVHDFKLHEAHGFDGIAPRFATPQILSFSHESGQASLIASYIRQYGTSLNGLGRILLRSHVNKLYRQASVVPEL
ncbi:MAG: hypothetical protein HYS20_09195, partial [Rhodocyclales bacterium]|nr:hypothetical protein [Rhodocyclales bacterium]